MSDMLHPALFMLLGALLIGPARGRLRSALVLLVPLCSLALIWQVPDGIQMSVEFLQYPIELIEGSPVRRLFATIFALMAFAGGLFAFRQAPIVILEIFHPDGGFDAGRPGHGFIHTDATQGRIGKGAPR